jgi:hypothetical protein
MHEIQSLFAKEVARQAEDRARFVSMIERAGKVLTQDVDLASKVVAPLTVDPLGPVKALQQMWARQELDIGRLLATQASVEKAFGLQLSVDQILAQVDAAGSIWRDQQQSVLAIRSDFDAVARACANLAHSVALPSPNPRLLITAPAEETFVHARVLEVVSVHPAPVKTPEDHRAGAPDDAASLLEGIDRENDEFLERDLANHPAGVLEMWQGAKRVLADAENPDRVRQFGGSIRELLTYLLHLGAPDTELRTWATNPQDYDKGKPTRRARLRFMARHYQREFEEFVEADIKAVLGLFEKLQQLVHERQTGFTPDEVRLIEMRAVRTIRFVLELMRPKGTES